jgi:hypothetical protein
MCTIVNTDVFMQLSKKYAYLIHVVGNTKTLDTVVDPSSGKGRSQSNYDRCGQI